ncbi:uncharacterized protein LOC124847835 [Vigna umbellata]|uniref:uncharacterized protein LOC124847835 n=1 Tax=Vigna umbellata TaxID=87088 RepID=UPI001F5F29B7|nr:uncharacterized protein LOC124847835 [Vigna umbellata]
MDHPVSKILRKPGFAGPMDGWAVKVSEFGLRYNPRGFVKGQHLADFEVELPQTTPNFEWNLFVDGASGQAGGGVGVVVKGPNEFLLEHSLVFKFKTSNNQAKYEALVAELELAKDMGVRWVTCRTDSYGKEKGKLTAVIRRVLTGPSVEYLAAPIIDDNNWKQEIVRLMKEKDTEQLIRPADARKIAQYVIISGDLYRRGFSTPLLKCLSEREAQYMLDELHNGVCDFHTGRKTLKDRAIKWGKDIVGPFPPGRAQKKFLLVAIDYFTKWVEAEALVTITTQQVQKFVLKLIKHVTSSMEHPQTNGQVEAINKTIVAELERRLGERKGAWVDELPEVLWAYRCTLHGTTGETSFNLNYDTDAMPVEVGESSLRRKLEDDQLNERELRVELDTLEERRESAIV